MINADHLLWYNYIFIEHHKDKSMGNNGSIWITDRGLLRKSTPRDPSKYKIIIITTTISKRYGWTTVGNSILPFCSYISTTTSMVTTFTFSGRHLLGN